MSFFGLFQCQFLVVLQFVKGNGVYVVLDVGLFKVVCFIVCMDEIIVGLCLCMVGVGYQFSWGVRGGVIVDMDGVFDVICVVVEQVECMVGMVVMVVSVSLFVGQFNFICIVVEVDLYNCEVIVKDLCKLLNGVLVEFQVDDCVILYVILLFWFVDDYCGICDLCGMYGCMLGVEVYVIMAVVGLLCNLMNCVECCYFNFKGVVVIFYVLGLFVLGDDEVKFGVILIDMGVGVLMVLVFVDGVFLYIDSVLFGGIYVIFDIVCGLLMLIVVVECFKVLYGCVLDSLEDDQ